MEPQTTIQSWATFVKYCNSASSALESPLAVIVAAIALYLRLVLTFNEEETSATAADTYASEGAVIHNKLAADPLLSSISDSTVEKSRKMRLTKRWN